MKKALHIFLAIFAIVFFSGCARFREAMQADGGFGGPTATTPPVVTPPPPPTSPIVEAAPGDLLSPAQIFANNQFAVFQIFAYHTSTRGYWGSGFFVCPTGIAVTNHHVMVGAGRAVAIMYDDTEFEIMGWHSYDFGNDLAVIQVDNRGGYFNAVTLSDSDEVRVGEAIFAIGGPEGDPITFTDGMVSRLVAQPVFFDGYSVSGMIQHTAAIYGGNSGGPLLNEAGHVIGINAAGRPDRASVQFAVPSNRIQMPAPGAPPNLLPLGRGVQWQPPASGGDVTYLTRYAFIPDIQSLSPNARLIMSGTPLDLGEEMGWLSHYYDYLYLYSLPAANWIADTDAFDEKLFAAGFEFQNIVHFDTEVWVYFFHPGHNTSLSYAFMRETETLLVAIGLGDAYAAFYHGGDTPAVRPPADPVPAPPPAASALIGAWQFTETTSRLYLDWSDAGEHIYYSFFEDGTGEFMTLNDAGTILRSFPFNWSTSPDSTVTIRYTTINLTLVYRYVAAGGGLRLSGDNEHLLEFIM